MTIMSPSTCSLALRGLIKPPQRPGYEASHILACSGKWSLPVMLIVDLSLAIVQHSPFQFYAFAYTTSLRGGQMGAKEPIVASPGFFVALS